MEPKLWYTSKTLWVSVIALIATAIQAKYGFIISPEYQGYILAIVMFVLRIITGEPVEFKAPPPVQ